MTPPKVENYRLAAERIAEGKWWVDPKRGLVFGVKGQPFVRRNSEGYVQIKFRMQGDWTKEVAVVAHRVIWEYVHGPLAACFEVNHINGDKADNRLVNLEAITPTENKLHARVTGLTPPVPFGEDNPNAKLSDDQVRTIFRRVHQGETGVSLAAEFGISPVQVSHIKVRRARRTATAGV